MGKPNHRGPLATFLNAYTTEDTHITINVGQSLSILVQFMHGNLFVQGELAHKANPETRETSLREECPCVGSLQL